MSFRLSDVQFGADGARGVLEQIDARRIQRPLVHPHDVRFQVPRGMEWRRRQDVAAAHVHFVFEREGHRHRRLGDGQVAVPGHDAFDAGRRPDGDTRIWSPGRIVPDAICPAYPRNSWFGRRTSWTGKRNG